MYKVIKAFTDLQDNNHLYKEGDTYPREGVSVLPSRVKELATTANRRSEILIKEIEDEPKPKKTAKSAKKVEKTEND